MSKNFKKNKYNRGVTLIELIVVIAIFTIISSITIFSYSKFNSSLSLQNLADDIALSVRKAQGYAIGVRGRSSVFSEGFGIHFTENTNISDLSAGSNKSFVLFSNIDDDENYDHNFAGCGSPTITNECLEVLEIKSSDKISEILAGSHSLNSDGTLNIFFKRPNPEPTFCARNADSTSCNFGEGNISNVKIRVSNSKDPGVYKTITISNNGQISVSDN